MPRRSTRKAQPVSRSAVVNSDSSLSIADKENVSPAKHLEEHINEVYDMEKVRALARSATLGRFKYLISAKEPKLRQIKSTIVGKRSIGKLPVILKLPFDVLCEVAGYLRPSDLLQVTRTSKALRALLTSKSSRQIWRAARKNTPLLPECPEDLSEPEYASLVFDKECQACGSRVKHARLTLRLRLCKPCLAVNTTGIHQYLKNAKFDQSLAKLFKLIAFDQLDNGAYLKYKHRDKLRFFQGDLALMSKALLSFESMPLARKVFIEERMRIVDSIHDGYIGLHSWITTVDQIRIDENRELKVDRHDAIVEKILGLDYELDDIHQATVDHEDEWRKLAWKSAVLTVRSWSSIRPKLEILLQDSKRRRESREKMDKTMYMCFHIFLTGRLPDSTYHLSCRIAAFVKNPVSLSNSELEWWKKAMDDKVVMRFGETPSFITFNKFLTWPSVISFCEDRREETITHEKLRELFLSIIPNLSFNHELSRARFINASIAGHQCLVDHAAETIENVDPRLKNMVFDALTKGDYIMIGPAALYSSDELSFDCLDCGEFLHKWADFVANADPDDPLARDLDPDFPECRPQVIFTAYVLLMSLNLGTRDVNMMDLLSMREAFVCLECEDEDRIRRTWPDTVRHFIKEADMTHQRKKDLTNGLTVCTFKRDHYFGRYPCISLDDYSPNLYPTQEESCLNDPYKWHCMLCFDKTQSGVDLLTKAEAETHALTSHSRAFNLDDFCSH